MSYASHRYVPLTGSSRDRRKRLRALKREFPMTPLEAISATPRQSYLTDCRSWNRESMMITTPGQ